MIIVASYLIVYLSLVGAVVLGGFLLHLRKSNKQSNGNKISADEITVLIPFRNEVGRLDVLLESFVRASKLPRRIVFIDDHSDDHSCELIKSRLKEIPFEILSLPDEVGGKKLALREGIKRCNTKYILTFDADISFQPNYFGALENLNEADMYVLPAVLKGENLSELFYELDVALANGLNTGLSGWSRPIFCSGANLLYQKEVFDEVDDFDSHAHMASGDDTYLLRDFRRNEKDVRVISDLDLAIHTETPHSFRAFIDQRLRWVGKTTDIGDSLATLAATGQFLLAVSFFVMLIYFGVGEYWEELIWLFTLKIGFDMFFFFPYFSRVRRLQSWTFIPVYELLFPLYSLLIGILMFSYRPKWKGRSIQK